MHSQIVVNRRGDQNWQGGTSFDSQNRSGGTSFYGGPIFSLQSNPTDNLENRVRVRVWPFSFQYKTFLKIF